MVIWGITYWSIIGVIEGDTGSLDCSSYITEEQKENHMETGGLWAVYRYTQGFVRIRRYEDLGTAPPNFRTPRAQGS